MQGNFVRAALGYAVCGWVAAANVGWAQVPHPIPPPARGLHELAAEAERIAIARVTRVDAGRVGVAREFALLGQLPKQFELKRSPLRPPTLAAGDRVLLFLRGERSPYVLAGPPDEVMQIASEVDARALVAALPALLAAADDLPAVRTVYESWRASPSALVRELGMFGLLAVEFAAPTPPLQPSVAAGRHAI